MQDEEKTKETETQENVEPVSMEGIKLLLVEDNELNREITCDILNEEGVIVEEAEDGRVAVEKVKQKEPDYYDVILMDIQMPFMNGYEATKAIRAMYADKHIPIIALSANAFEEDRQKSLSAGMDDHVAKPIEVETLKKTLCKSACRKSLFDKLTALFRTRKSSEKRINLT